jgi:interleukin-1 receptor-associated kinase 4
VFRGVLPSTETNSPISEEVAVKVLKGDLVTSKQFVNEIQIMKEFRHDNLLPLIAVSTDGPFLCLVSKFMPKGSLNRHLSRHGCDFSPQERVRVAIGTARGISHLHTFLPQPFVHRDVKSDNILLDDDLTPKVGDFGLTRIGGQGSGSHSTTKQFKTANVIGTSVYMAPEAFRGDVSVKLDIFAFGVVLLELLTGLKPYDEEREEPDILSHIEDQLEDDGTNVESLSDSRTSGWTTYLAECLLKLSQSCTSNKKKDRPNMTQVLSLLEGMTGQI